MHDVGVVHRDLKPSNVFLSADGTVKLLDFGVATADVAEASPLTRPDAQVGSVPYMAPEQRLSAANVDARVDVWSLGVTLYETLAGRCAPGFAPSPLAADHKCPRRLNVGSCRDRRGAS